MPHALLIVLRNFNVSSWVDKKAWSIFLLSFSISLLAMGIVLAGASSGISLPFVTLAMAYFVFGHLLSPDAFVFSLTSFHGQRIFSWSRK